MLIVTHTPQVSLTTMMNCLSPVVHRLKHLENRGLATNQDQG